MKYIVFFVTWVGYASFVDYFHITGGWAMLCGLFALATSDFINYALELNHGRA